MLRLKAERMRRGISQRRLAEMADIHVVTLSKVENGRVYPYPGWRKRLAEVLGWPAERADELFEEVEEDAPKA